MKKFYQEFFEYNYRVNEELELSFKSHNYEMGEEITRLANHMLNALEIWLARINQQHTLSSPWVDFPLGLFEKRNLDLYKEALEVVNNQNLEGIISYQNFAGKEFENKVSDILTHVVNHSTYHRGQIALLMRSKGFEPILSDFIYYKK